jgi:hypothetical protein
MPMSWICRFFYRAASVIVVGGRILGDVVDG